MVPSPYDLDVGGTSKSNSLTHSSEFEPCLDGA